MSGFRFIDLFAGIGGFRIGFERAGGRCVFACEIDRHARKVYTANHGEGDHPFPEDITKVDAADIPEHDVLLAGFPCQAFSIGGARKGFDDARGTLFFEVARILDGCRTPAFVLENVEGLLTHDGGETWRRIHDTLRRIGYHVGYRKVSAAAWVPQNRVRVFIAGHRERRGFASALDFAPFPDPATGPRLGSILEPEPADCPSRLGDREWAHIQRRAARAPETRRPVTVAGPADVANTLPATYRKGAGARLLIGEDGEEAADLDEVTLTDGGWQYIKDKATAGFSHSVFGPDGVAGTLVSQYRGDGGGRRILIRRPSRNPRRLTARECSRLMGFDRGRESKFKIPVARTRAYRLFGNAVCPPVAEAIAKAVVPELEPRP